MTDIVPYCSRNGEDSINAVRDAGTGMGEMPSELDKVTQNSSLLLSPNLTSQENVGLAETKDKLSVMVNHER